jgi:DNA polymerase III alpha subunit
MKTAEFDCGCWFPVDNNGKIIFEPHIGKLNLECRKTWDLVCSGDTLGIFQLESRLGKGLSKRVLPRSVEELADLISIMRPGVLEAMENGKTMTQHYIDRKHGISPVEYFHPALEPIVKKTYGIMVYQEQAMQIAKDIAGFTLQEADSMRKAIGKKLPEEMAKVKTLFMIKAKELGIVTEEQAVQIWEWIEKSQRYSFNKSHAVAYAMDGYISAYAKYHFPREFFTSYLAYSKEEQNPTEVVEELVANSKRNNIDVFPPDIRKRNLNFKLYDDGIYCGISNVKSVGKALLSSLDSLISGKEAALGKPLDKWNWMEFLLQCALFIKKDALANLIQSGALSYLKVSRRRMLYEVEKVLELSDRDTQWLGKMPGDTVLEKLKNFALSPVGRGKPLPSKKTLEKVLNIIKTLENPPYSLEDTAVSISEGERQTIGISLTCSKIDDCDQSSANCTCKEFLDGKSGYVLIACCIDEARNHIIKTGSKRGEHMGMLRVSDSTCQIENCIAFPESWALIKDTVIEGNTVMLGGNRDKKNKDTFIVNKAWQL